MKGWSHFPQNATAHQVCFTDTFIAKSFLKLSYASIPVYEKELSPAPIPSLPPGIPAYAAHRLRVQFLDKAQECRGLNCTESLDPELTPLLLTDR